jgi:hypothetical protein
MSRRPVTAKQKIREARRVMLEAALGMTRIRQPLRLAVKLVLLQGKRPSEAARDKRVKLDRRFVHRALLKVRPHLAQIEEEVRRLNGN